MFGPPYIVDTRPHPLLTCVRNRCHPIVQMPLQHQIRPVARHPIDGHPVPCHMLPVVAHHGAAQDRRRTGRHQQRDEQKDQRRRCVRTRQHRRQTGRLLLM